MKRILCFMMLMILLFTLISCETEQAASSADLVSEPSSTIVEPEPEPEKYSISFIPLYDTNYSLYMKEGCRQAIEDLKEQNIYIDFSVERDDFAVHSSLVKNRINSKTDKKDAIILESRYSEEDIYNAAKEKDVKLVLLDSSNFEQYELSNEADIYADAVYMKNSYEDGKLAAELLLNELKEKDINSGKIALIGIETDYDFYGYRWYTVTRETSFISVIEDTEYELVDARTDNLEDSLEVLEKMLHNRENNEFVGFISFDDYRMDLFADVIENSGLSESTVTVCFDKRFSHYNVDISSYMETFEDHSLDYDINTNPYQMGYQGMMGAVEMLRGEKIESKINYVPPIVISQENYWDNYNKYGQLIK